MWQTPKRRGHPRRFDLLPTYQAGPLSPLAEPEPLPVRSTATPTRASHQSTGGFLHRQPLRSVAGSARPRCHGGCVPARAAQKRQAASPSTGPVGTDHQGSPLLWRAPCSLHWLRTFPVPVQQMWSRPPAVQAAWPLRPAQQARLMVTRVQRGPNHRRCAAQEWKNSTAAGHKHPQRRRMKGSKQNNAWPDPSPALWC